MNRSRTRWQRLPTLIAVATLVVASATHLHAQRGQIAGQVRDTLGNPIQGAEVILDGGVHRLRTDVKGEFILVSVEVGRHRVLVRAIGFRPIEVTDIQVTSGGFVRIPFRLEPGPIEIDAIRVTSDQAVLIAPDINASRETTNRETLATMPVQTVGQVVARPAGLPPATGALPAPSSRRHLLSRDGRSSSNPPEKKSGAARHRRPTCAGFSGRKCSFHGAHLVAHDLCE